MARVPPAFFFSWGDQTILRCDTFSWRLGGEKLRRGPALRATTASSCTESNASPGGARAERDQRAPGKAPSGLHHVAEPDIKARPQPDFLLCVALTSTTPPRVPAAGPGVRPDFGYTLDLIARPRRRTG